MNPKYQEKIMKKWQSIPTLGFTKAVSLILMTSVITMGSSIASQIPLRDRNTLEESTSCKSENQKEEREGSQASQTGRSTTEALMILSRILEEMAEILSEEKSSPSTQPLDK